MTLLISVTLCLSLAIFSSNAIAQQVDPTGPFGHSGKSSQVAAEKKLVLESIIHGDGIHTVVINGQVMRPNDTIGEYRLTAVNDQSVILRSDTQRLKLHIFKESVVK
jgi:MSHA biogenesis protein MshK